MTGTAPLRIHFTALCITIFVLGVLAAVNAPSMLVLSMVACVVLNAFWTDTAIRTLSSRNPRKEH